MKQTNRNSAWLAGGGVSANSNPADRVSYKSEFGQSQRHISNPSHPSILEFIDVRNCIYLACSEVYRFNRPMSLLVVAIDGMAQLRSHYGSQAAFEASRFVTDILCNQKDLIFGKDAEILIGQYIEDRYFILMPGFPGTVASDYAEILRKAVVERDFLWNSRYFTLTISVGIAHKPGHRGDQDELILQADEACDQMIACGGNRISIAKVRGYHG